MTAPEADDDTLVEQARAGGTAGQRAYGLLVQRHRMRVVRLVGHLLGRSGDAEDVAQEAFVRAYLGMPRYPKGALFWPWIRTIATRLAYNHRRDKGTRQRYEDRAKASCASRSALPERDAMDRALGRISYPFREALVLRHVEGMSIEELACELGIGLSAAKMRLARARSEFQAEFERLTG